jgi:hypothetical protein
MASSAGRPRAGAARVSLLLLALLTMCAPSASMVFHSGTMALRMPVALPITVPASPRGNPFDLDWPIIRV